MPEIAERRTLPVPNESRFVTARDVMRSAVTTVERGAHLAAATYLMKQAGATALVVISDDVQRAPIAILTDADIAQVVADGRDVNSTRLSDLVGTTPVTTSPETPIAIAAELMLSSGVNHLPVVEDSRLVGMLCMSDACRGLLMSRADASDSGLPPVRL